MHWWLTQNAATSCAVSPTSTQQSYSIIDEKKGLAISNLQAEKYVHCLRLCHTREWWEHRWRRICFGRTWYQGQSPARFHPWRSRYLLPGSTCLTCQSESKRSLQHSQASWAEQHLPCTLYLTTHTTLQGYFIRANHRSLNLLTHHQTSHIFQDSSNWRIIDSNMKI
jgi:hypothetical protein